MVKQGDSIIMTVEEFMIAEQKVMITTVEKLKEDLRLNYWEEMLTPRQAAKDLGVSIDKVYDWSNEEKTKHKMPFQGQPKRITRREARDWFNKFSNIYSK